MVCPGDDCSYTYISQMVVVNHVELLLESSCARSYKVTFSGPTGALSIQCCGIFLQLHSDSAPESTVPFHLLTYKA